MTIFKCFDIVANMGTGASPLSGQEMDHDPNQPTKEAGEVDDLIGVNQSYVTQGR